MSGSSGLKRFLLDMALLPLLAILFRNMLLLDLFKILSLYASVAICNT